MSSSLAESLLLERGALLKGHFLLSSGLHSERYLQCAVALQHPDTAEALGRALADACLRVLGAPPDVVVSPALGGVIIGHETGRALGVRACFTERVDGSMTLRRGFALREGESVLLVEDVVTTGLSSEETLDAIRGTGADPLAAACIANRSGRERVGGLPLVSLLELQAPTYSASECPRCAAGDSPVKPGSRGN